MNFFEKYTARLLRTCNFDIVTVWIWCIQMFILVELIFIGIEYLFWGEHFPHFGDVLLSIILFSYFGFTTWVMGDYKEAHERSRL